MPYETKSGQAPGAAGSDGSDRSVGSNGSGKPATPDPAPQRLRPSGGYRNLRSFHVTTLVYDATVSFCQRFVDPRSRTTDQMVQAARSGRQNIAEGSRAAATSSQTELRLVNVARASLDELLLDYEDFLRQRDLRSWMKSDPETLAVRAIGRALDKSERADPSGRSARLTTEAYGLWFRHRDPMVVANTIICLIHQANYLLDQQIAAVERDFIEGGGYTEQLAAARSAERLKQGASGMPSPACPRCEQPMLLRTARQGANRGSQFWGCTAYPQCKGTRKAEA